MKLVHLVGFITKKFVTVHGHMNVKKLSYMFRRLLRHLQGELYRMLQTIVTLYVYVRVFWRQLIAPIHFIIPYCCISFEQFVLKVLIVVD